MRNEEVPQAVLEHADGQDRHGEGEEQEDEKQNCKIIILAQKIFYPKKMLSKKFFDPKFF